jgi:hypothetical protein
LLAREAVGEVVARVDGGAHLAAHESCPIGKWTE